MDNDNKSSVQAYSSPPKTELELQRLQSIFLEDKNNKKSRDELFTLIRTYARSITLKRIKRLGIFLPPERVDEISTDITLAIFEQYSNEGWKVGLSFAGVINFKLLEAMYSHKGDEMNSSLNLTFSDDKDSKEIIDLVDSGAMLPWDGTQYSGIEVSNDPSDSLIEKMNVAYSEVEDVIKEAYMDLPYRVYLRFLPWLVLQFRKPKTKNIQSLFNRLYLTTKEENAFDVLLLEIYQRISQHVI